MGFVQNDPPTIELEFDTEPEAKEFYAKIETTLGPCVTSIIAPAGVNHTARRVLVWFDPTVLYYLALHPDADLENAAEWCTPNGLVQSETSLSRDAMMGPPNDELLGVQSKADQDGGWYREIVPQRKRRVFA